ncbi:MAG: hypothetical protein AAF492_08580 [Verrucomicrobiota bacterium]
MNLRDIADLALKLLGVYVFIQFCGLIPSLAYMFQYTPTDGYEDAAFLSQKTSTLVLVGIYLVSAFGLFAGARRLSGFFVPDSDETFSVSGEVSPPIVQVMFQGLGIWALIQWGPELVQALMQTLLYGSWSNPIMPISLRFYDNWSIITGPLLGTICGLLLVFKARGVMKLIRLTGPEDDPAPRPDA